MRIGSGSTGRGGTSYLAEFHPFSVVLGEEEFTVADSYVDPGPFLHDEPGSYADSQASSVSSATTASMSAAMYASAKRRARARSWNAPGRSVSRRPG